VDEATGVKALLAHINRLAALERQRPKRGQPLDHLPPKRKSRYTKKEAK